MSAECIVKVILDPAPPVKIKVTEAPVVVKLVPEAIKVLTVVEGVKGDPGADGADGAPGPQGPPGTAGQPSKTGVVPGASFAGTPKKFAVVFATPYADSTYAIAIAGTDSRSYTYESKTAAGFTINANADAAIVGEVSWITMTSGET